MKTAIIIEARREGYAPDQCYNTITAGELAEILQGYDEDTPVYLSHDNGYTYGSLRGNDIDLRYGDDEYEDDEIDEADE